MLFLLYINGFIIGVLFIYLFSNKKLKKKINILYCII